MTRRDRILKEVSFLVGKLMYYDRKEDEDLPRGQIEDAIANNEITIEEIVVEFENEIRK